MNKQFSIELSSDLDFEGMIIDVIYDTEPIASINYEKGLNKMEIELHPTSENLLFPLNDFFLALEKAKKLAIKCAKEDELRKQ